MTLHNIHTGPNLSLKDASDLSFWFGAFEKFEAGKAAYDKRISYICKRVNNWTGCDGWEIDKFSPESQCLWVNCEYYYSGSTDSEYIGIPFAWLTCDDAHLEDELRLHFERKEAIRQLENAARLKEQEDTARAARLVTYQKLKAEFEPPAVDILKNILAKQDVKKDSTADV